MKRPWLLLLIGVAIVAAGAGLFWGIRDREPQSTYKAPQSQLPDYRAITPPPSPPTALYQTPSSAGRGLVLVDQAHSNNFLPTELQSLTPLILSQGFSLTYLENAKEQEEKLRQADAFIVIAPERAYSSEEVAGVRRFVNQGGKVLLLADPARVGEINSLAREFGLTFEEDYLYNLQDNVGNYRYIYFRDFQEHPITQGLKTLALYTAGSIAGQGQGLAFGDENTRSSLYQDRKKPFPIAQAQASRVLLIHDLTFLREPFMTTLDNSRLISNIAQWLTRSERVFLLSDFPHLFQDSLTVAYADPSLWDMAQGLRDFFLKKEDKRPELGGYEKGSSLRQDLLYIGLFRHSQQVKEYLEKANLAITVTGEIQGRVVDGKTEDPVEGALISVLSGELSYDIQAKGDGSYLLNHLLPGTYELTASGKGHREKRASLRLGEGEKLEQHFPLTALGQGGIRGCVKEAAKEGDKAKEGDSEKPKPIEGAKVIVAGTDFQATTQQDGCYQIKGVYEGSYQIAAQAEGYKPLTLEVKVVPQETAPADLALSPGKAEEIVVKKGSLQGQVKDADSQEPIGKAEVVVKGAKFSDSTDSQGSYTLRAVPEGTYQVTVRAQGYKPLTKKVRVVAQEEVSADFDLVSPLMLVIKGVGKIPQKGTAILYLSPGPGPRVLLCLADTQETLRKAVNLLKDGGFRKWLVRDNLALYQAEGKSLSRPF